jgi:surface protein
MFSGASAFNQDISNWDVSSGTSFVSSKEVESVNAIIECESSCGFVYFLYTIQATFSFTITSLPLLLYFYNIQRVECFILLQHSTKISQIGMLVKEQGL